ncbi:MAG: DapH/DapD/GlmU-related protein [Vampirovibrionales bacterium]
MMNLCDVLMSIYPHATIHKGAIVEDGVQLEEGVEIFPYCFIGKNVVIKAGAKILPFTTLIGNTVIGENTEVRHSFLEDAVVGEHCFIGPFAHLRPGSVIARNVKIGNFVETKNASIGENTFVSHLSYVGDASVGANVNIGAGTITANFNPYTGEKSHTSIGDHATVGANSVLIAPVTVEAGAAVAASSTITDTVPTGSLAIARQKQRNIINWVEKHKKNQEI